MNTTKDIALEPSWKAALATEFEAEYFKKLAAFVRAEYKSSKVFPAPKQIFRALDVCPLEATRVVILGQDPYHGDGQANGLCFAVPANTALPPSLQNIFQEIKNDLGIEPRADGDLARWAAQGVLLLNATLTVRAHAAGSHQHKGWEQFTDAVIDRLSKENRPLVFLLWGNYARKKGLQIGDKFVRSRRGLRTLSGRGFLAEDQAQASTAGCCSFDATASGRRSAATPSSVKKTYQLCSR